MAITPAPRLSSQNSRSSTKRRWGRTTTPWETTQQHSESNAGRERLRGSGDALPTRTRDPRRRSEREPQHAHGLHQRLGSYPHWQGQLPGGGGPIRRVLQIAEKTVGPDNLNLAGNIDNLAHVHSEEHDYKGAETLLRRELAIQEAALGPDQPGVATTLNSLACLLYTEGAYKEAEPLSSRQSLHIEDRALGSNSLDVATTADNLANTLGMEGDDAEAVPLAEQALTIREHALGPHNPSVAASLDILGKILYDSGDHAGAERLYRRANGIQERALKPDDPNLAITLRVWESYSTLRETTEEQRSSINARSRSNRSR